MGCTVKQAIYIYMGSQLYTFVPGVDKRAWHEAEGIVRYLGQGESEWSTTPGRVSFSRGRFRAVNAVRFD